MFPYDAQFAPPAPVLAIEVFLPAAPERREQLFAKLDTGADISGIPSRVISQWGMEPASEIILNNLYVRLNGPELTFDVRTTPGT